MPITLRPYQQEAADELAKKLQRYGVAYLAGEVRCGKTLTVLSLLEPLGIAKALLLTKKKAIASIVSDAEAIGVDGRVTVTNFEQAPKHAGQHYELLVVDEAHGVGAFPKPSKRFKDIKAISYGQLILMSGTPSPESYSQLYHQFALAGIDSPWREYSNFYGWARVYVTMTQKYVGTGQLVNDYSKAKGEEVLERIEPYTVRMTQQQAGFKAVIEEQVHLVKMKRRTYRLAQRIMRDGVIGRPDCRSVVADTGAKVMSKLRQIWSGSVITEAHGAVIFDQSKAEYIKRTFKGKTAILYTFQAEGIMLRQLYGAAATDSPEVFNADADAVFIGQVLASREGVNLSSADDLVFFGVDYSALSYLQGRDRASYLGRDRANRVHWILADKGIEQTVLGKVRSKEDYTTQHYRKERERLSADVNQALREGGLVCGEANPNKSIWSTRSLVAAAQ